MEMACHCGLDARRLIQMLGVNLEKNSNWLPQIYKATGTQNDLLGEDRDRVVKWILSLNTEFRFTPETLAMAIQLLDRFLQLVKVRPKYLHCVAISCLYIAAKTLEEQEVIPSTVTLVKTIKCVCTVSEVLRMEAIILDKLSWDIKHVTAVDLLHNIHGLLMCYYPKLLDGLNRLTPSQHLSIMMRKLFNCLGQNRMLVYSPCLLVLSIVSLELEQITPDWFSIVCMVQQMARIENETFIRCREQVGLFLSKQHLLPTGYQFKMVKRSKSVKRKAVDDDEEDIYDGIKRLYSEDLVSEASVAVRMSCGSELFQHQDTDGGIFIPAVSAN